jgi:hypothetical protein
MKAMSAQQDYRQWSPSWRVGRKLSRDEQRVDSRGRERR